MDSNLHHSSDIYIYIYINFSYTIYFTHITIIQYYTLLQEIQNGNQLFLLWYHATLVSHPRFLSPSDYKRLANFTVLVGGNADWRYNKHCYSQLPPVPEGATVEYPCETMRLGHLVSINKTASAELGSSFRMLLLHEVQVFGYKSGKMTKWQNKCTMSKTSKSIDEYVCYIDIHYPIKTDEWYN